MSYNQAVATWVLTDWYGSDFTEDVKPTFEAKTSAELKHCLRIFRDMEPRVVHLEGVPGMMIRVGIGGPYGHVYVTCLGSQNQVWLAVAPRIIAGDEVTFVYDYQPSPFPPKYLLSADDVERIVIEIAKTGGLPEWVRWERR